MKTTSIFKIIVLAGLLYSPTVQGQIITPANNFISVDLNTPQNTSFTYDSAMVLGKNLGMSQIGLHFLWTKIETAPDTFDFTFLDIANVYYPAYNISVNLNIDPIETNHLEVPSDLISLAFDNPIVINRFKKLLDSVKVHIPSLQLSSLVIGSEVDASLGANAALWKQYTTFYDSVSMYAKTLWPGLKVATELTFGGITTQNTFAQILNTNSNYIGVSYYPLNNNYTVKPVSAIPADFSTLVGLYPSKPICFYQFGCPSGSSCNSSQTLQAQFIAKTFTSWDTYASNIRMIDFTWLHDIDSASVNYYSTYYGVTDTIFLEFLGTLGLRTWYGMGTDKLALDELRCQAKQRGYNTLSITCSTGINENTFSENILSIYPNPFFMQTTIQSDKIFNGATLTVYNLYGQQVNQIKNISGQTVALHRDNLPRGLYFIRMTQDNKTFSTGKLVITDN
jgi:hypothetical protein